jgi:putative peptidoglycan lipid II flippase
MALDTPGTPLPDAPPTERIARSASLAGSATLTSRILGLVREQVLAGVFGAGNDMDAYLVALRVPSLVRDLFAEGAMSAAFVPTFARHVAQHGKAAAWRLANNVITALLVVTGSLVVLGMIFAGPIVSLYAPEFASVPGKLELTVFLGRLMLPFLTMVAIAAVMMGMLNSLQHYFIPALAPATFNVATIACLALLPPLMPILGLEPIVVLAIATLLGGMLQAGVQWPSLRREGFRYRPRLDFSDPGLRQILILMGPGTLGLAATQINLFVTTQLATYQGVGTVSWLQFAFRLIYLPIGVFGVSIATAVLPTVAAQAAGHDRRAIAATLSRACALMMIVNIPASVGLIVLSDDIVRLLFERGRFLPGDTAATAAALRCFAIGLLGYAVSRMASPVFYALGRSRVSVIISTTTIVLNVVLGVLLVPLFGFIGLALATSFSALFSAAVLLILLGRHLGGLDLAGLAATLSKSGVAALVMGIAVWVAGGRLAALIPGTTLLPQLARVTLSVATGLAAYGGMAVLLRISEASTLLAGLRRRA